MPAAAIKVPRECPVDCKTQLSRGAGVDVSHAEVCRQVLQCVPVSSGSNNRSSDAAMKSSIKWLTMSYIIGDEWGWWQQRD